MRYSKNQFEFLTMTDGKSLIRYSSKTGKRTYECTIIDEAVASPVRDKENPTQAEMDELYRYIRVYNRSAVTNSNRYQFVGF